MEELATADFDLHGLVRLRLVDATLDDVKAVSRQLGLPSSSSEGDPDITVAFVERVHQSPLTYVSVAESGFTAEDFFISTTRRGALARVTIPFDAIGKQPELFCERGAREVPHLLAIINLTMLTKGVLPLHASAFNFSGVGVLVAGWAKSGKTETLLAAGQRGARYVGDEWVYLKHDGTMLGIPEPIRVWAWHLGQLPNLRRSRSPRERGRLLAWQGLAGIAQAATRVKATRALAGKAVPPLRRQAYLRLPPADIFGADRVDLRGRLDTAFLLVSSSSDSVVVRPAAGTELAARMLASLAQERAPLLKDYAEFRYAFPDRESQLIEQTSEIEARLLAELFEDRPITKIEHPYPCSIEALADAVITAALAQQDPGRGVEA